jgi:peptide/nickel transport system substrate-binding protein
MAVNFALRLVTAIALCAAMTFSAAVAQNRELVIAQAIDTPGFDPHGHSTGAVEAIHVNIFDYLVTRTPEGKYLPALATEWEQVSDTAMRFKLREGVLFHDGSTLKAEDVKFSLERPALNKDIFVHSFYETIREIEVINDLEFVIHTKKPDPIRLNRITFNGAGIVPKHYVDAVGWKQFSLKPIGTGPYRMVEWRRDDRVIMEAFDKYWRGRPAYDRLVHRTIPEDSTRVGELISGGVDIATNIPSQDVARINASGVATTKPWPGLRVMELFVNTKKGSPLADPKVREAIDLAIDERALIDTVMSGHGVPVRAGVVPGVTAVPMDLYNTYLYDPERAKKLLAEAGYKPGQLKIKLQGPAGRYPLDVELMEVIAVMLGAVGVEVEIEALEWSVFQSRVWLPNAVEGLALIGHANSLGDGYYSVQRARCGAEYSKITGWCNDRFNQLVDLAAGTINPVPRAEYLYEAFHLLTDSRSILFLFQLDNTIGISKDVDWTPTPDERLWMFAAKPAK